MKKGNKLYHVSHNRRAWNKVQPEYIGISESQIKELVKTGNLDEVPACAKKSMAGGRVYGYDAEKYYRGYPNWNYVGRWLRKRLGQPKAKVEEEFVALWKQHKMPAVISGGYGPIEYLNKYYVDSKKGDSRYCRGYYWDEDSKLQVYPLKRLWKNDWPDYSTIQKRKENKEVFEARKGNIRGIGPIPIGDYYIDEDRGKALHHCLAIWVDAWNQDLPEDQHFKTSFTFRMCPALDRNYLDYLHKGFKPVNILGIGTNITMPEPEGSELRRYKYTDCNPGPRYVFVTSRF